MDALDGGGVFGLLSAGYVVFAPTDQAFGNMTQGSLDALLADKVRLRTVMGYHIVDRRKLSEDGIGSIEAVHGSLVLMTLQGESVRIDGNGQLTVNGARILGSKRYDNGIIYAIDRVLDPSEDADISYGEEAAEAATGSEKVE